MKSKNRPAVDRTIEPMHGVSRDGQPLSYNRAAAPDLSPWIAGLYATVVDAPADYRLDCGIFNDTAMIRIQLKGDWTAQTADGPRQYGRAALFFGVHDRLMPVSVAGSFVSVGMAMRAGSGYALVKTKSSDFVDRILPCSELGLPGEQALAALDLEATPEEWLQTLERIARGIVDRVDGRLPDPVSARFEALALTDPTISVTEFVRDSGIEQRRLERLIRRDFGLSPKQVLRRARALDMAAHLRGVADHEEGDELVLRYYDQSHLIREFVDLFGMSPSQFVASPQPILTLALESRQARRLEALARLAPGEKRPWEKTRDVLKDKSGSI